MTDDQSQRAELELFVLSQLTCVYSVHESELCEDNGSFGADKGKAIAIIAA